MMNKPINKEVYMHAKSVLKRVLVSVLTSAILMNTLAYADPVSEDMDMVGGANDTVSEEDMILTTGATAQGSVDPSTCDEDYYQYILDYYNIDEGTLNYTQYLEKHGEVKNVGDFYVSAVEAYEAANHYEGMKPEKISVSESSLPREVYSDDSRTVNLNRGNEALKLDEKGFVDFKFTVPVSGYYYPSLDFYNITSKNSNIQRAIFIDGQLPYSELTRVELKRMWINKPSSYDVDSNGRQLTDKDGYLKWHADNQGNDLKASQVEVHDWQRYYLYDSQGFYTDELAVYLEAGEHVLTLYSITEVTVLYAINFTHLEKTPTYSEYLEKTASLGGNASGQMIEIQAESATLKSSQMLYPQQDQSSAIIRPYSPRLLLNNVIGGNSWRLIGDWLEWEFEVKQTGYYNIELLCKQNFVKGVYVSRRITIDGVVPFEEVNEYGFSYENTWFYDVLGGEKEPYKFYLTEGKHTIRMTVVLGDFGDIVGRVSDVTDDLNKIYREVICVTGTSPDQWRDYQVTASLPGLTDELKAAHAKLDSIIKDFEALVGKGSDKERALTTMRKQLEELIEDNEDFVKVVGDYRSNVRACGTWIADVIGQPLALDSIYIYSADNEVKERKNGFFKKFMHEMKRLFFSFIVDYDIVGDVSEPGDDSPELVLWVGTGRDQSNVIKSMISEDFTANYGINVTVMLVDISTLLQATLAGQGPDVAIEVGFDLPVNYGLRNAVVDLSQFSDINEVLERFDDSAYEAYKYGNSVYALPCAQTFLVMFYRKDILKELGIEPPETWQEMITALTVMSQNNMDLGMLPGEEVFLMFLLQNGGEYYNADGSKTLLDTEEAINAFTYYCKWYTDYGVDKTTNVEQRFRTGESPIIIYNFGYYNTLQVSAPDINGLWGVTQVPGTERVDKDGNTYIDHTIASVGNACVIMEACKDKESAWKFIKWWTDAPTQVMYSHEMESINGPSAKVATANLEAFQEIGYPVNFTNTINEQRSTIRGIRQIAGSYFTFRYINNAFYAVTADTNASTPREELTDRITYINDEIEYKRNELGLNK